MTPDAAETAADLRLAIGRLVRRTRRETTTLPPSQAAVLGRIDRDGPQTVADLAASERVSHQSMTRLVGDLVASGLAAVATPPPGADRRRKPVTLTEAGAAALREQRSLRSTHLARAIETRLSAAEHRTLAAAIPLLERLAEG
ncbi:MarR family winged helix-turn-helix transcriptional regulator [Agromyces sp. MMS24-JH15]|uniref:MarR family winged helix-turn-helix transcriptional regulator n=1 Tax=Agromyces sp. MMS24-JH15 TaxID=3243765 RepID=UPI0037487965